MDRSGLDLLVQARDIVTQIVIERMCLQIKELALNKTFKEINQTQHNSNSGQNITLLVHGLGPLQQSILIIYAVHHPRTALVPTEKWRQAAIQVANLIHQYKDIPVVDFLVRVKQEFPDGFQHGRRVLWGRIQQNIEYVRILFELHKLWSVI